MTRRTLAPAAIVLAAIAAPLAAHAQQWPGAQGSMRRFEVEIPEGALPPGPAEAAMKPGSTETRERFDMPAAGAARVTLWADYVSTADRDQRDVVVTSARGGTFVAIADARAAAHDNPRFVGSADELAAFTRAIAADPKAQALMRNIQLGDRSEIAAPDCRRLAFARAVVVVLRGDEPLDGLLACAARGADLLIIGHLAAGADAQAKRLARFDWAHPAVAWGLGVVVWRPGMSSDIAGAVAQMDGHVNRQPIESILSGSYGVAFEGVGETPRGVPGSRLVMLLLALYVAVIGPVGYFVGVRPRRPLLAWCWFPAVAAAATLALAAASTMWRDKPAEIALTRVRLVSPIGAGLETRTVRLQGASAARFSLSFPWHDSDLRSVDKGYRFGTPFASPAGSLGLTADRIANLFTIDGITVGRFGNGGASWIGPVDGSAFEVKRNGEQFAIVNRTQRPIQRAVLSFGGKCHTVENLPAGGERVPDLADCDHIRWPGSTSPMPGWGNFMPRMQDRGIEGMYLLMAQVDDLPAELEPKPAVRVRTTDIVAVIGPFVQEAPAR